MLLALLAAAFLPAPPANDWIIPAGTHVRYDTSLGPVDAQNVIIETGATLLVFGAEAFRLRAAGRIRIDGTLELSGADAPDVNCLNCGSHQSPPGAGAAGGGTGGIGNVWTTTWNDAGGDATDALGGAAPGGKGGDSAYRLSLDEFRRPGGGGGGAFGPRLPLVHPDPNHPLNHGRFARPGFDGSALANSAVHGAGMTPQGGASDGLVFVDGSDANDFWGRELDTFSGQITVGELSAPLAGRGGGGGGNTMYSGFYPPGVPFDPDFPEKGAGGGGGGGLGIVSALLVQFGPAGKIRCNGGRGGAGENSLSGGITRIGGGGGGGSGGMLILQARVIDLRHADANAIVALGGAGGRGENNLFNVTCAGGSGGPGLIQLHVEEPGQVLLPPGVTLDALTLPTAHVLLQETLP